MAVTDTLKHPPNRLPIAAMLPELLKLLLSTLVVLAIVGAWVVGMLDPYQKKLQELLLDVMGENKVSYGLKSKSSLAFPAQLADEMGRELDRQEACRGQEPQQDSRPDGWQHRWAHGERRSRGGHRQLFEQRSLSLLRLSCERRASTSPTPRPEGVRPRRRQLRIHGTAGLWSPGTCACSGGFSR